MDDLLPELVLRVDRDGQPFSGGWVIVTLDTDRKNDFRSLHGPTDENGIVVVRAEEIREQAERTRNLVLTDYGSIKANWTGAITVSPMTPDDLDVVIDAIDTWGPEQYPPGLRAALSASASRFPEHWDGELKVEVVEGPTSTLGR